MSEEWIVRVQGKEYGPVDLETLREWKTDGRVVPANEARKVDVDLWIKAGEIPDLFAPIHSIASEDIPVRQRSLREILVDTGQIYRKGFWQFLFLSALVVVPSICAQLSSAALGSPTNMEMDIRTFLAATFNFSMLLLSLAAWPLYIAGIQLLTNDLSAGRSVAVFDLIQRALKFWPRVALLWLFVCLSYFFWTISLVGAIFVIILGSQSLLSTFLALLVLALWIWLIGRLWVNFLFWQQFAVLSDSDFGNALRQGKELARSGRDLPWFRRPLWRGVFIYSFWCVLAFALSIGPEWTVLQRYLHELANAPDPQALLQSLSAKSKPMSIDLLRISLGLIQAALRPLLGIAFVLLYFDSKTLEN